MRRIILVLCLLLACGLVAAGNEEMVAEKKTAPAGEATPEQKTDAEPPANAVQAEAEVGAEPDAGSTDDAACRESFNTLEDIYGADKEALAAHLAELAKLDENGDDEDDDDDETSGVEWTEVPAEDRPDR